MSEAKRLISLLLATILCLSLLPSSFASEEPSDPGKTSTSGEMVSVEAGSPPEAESFTEAIAGEDAVPSAETILSGTIGTDNNISWRIKNSVLTISGTGRMPAAAVTWYEFREIPEAAPWKNFKDAFTSVVVEEGITRVGVYAFRDCDNIKSVTLPAGLTSIGEFAFYNCRSLTSINLPEGLTDIETGAFAFAGLSLINTKMKDYVRFYSFRLLHNSIIITTEDHHTEESIFSHHVAFGCCHVPVIATHQHFRE